MKEIRCPRFNIWSNESGKKPRKKTSTRSPNRKINGGSRRLMLSIKTPSETLVAMPIYIFATWILAIGFDHTRIIFVVRIGRVLKIW